MKISYAVTVCDEFEEIKTLLTLLLNSKRDKDEIVVLVDLTKTTPTSELLGYLHKLSSNDHITLVEDIFNNHFAKWKNRLSRACKGMSIKIIGLIGLICNGEYIKIIKIFNGLEMSTKKFQAMKRLQNYQLRKHMLYTTQKI